MKKELKNLMLKIRKERPKQVFIPSTKEYDVLWGQMQTEMEQRKLHGGIMFTSQDWCIKGYDNFICMGIPIVLRENDGFTPTKPS